MDDVEISLFSIQFIDSYGLFVINLLLTEIWIHDNIARAC